MAFADTQIVSTAATQIGTVLARPFVAIGNFLVGLAEGSSVGIAINQLSQISDDTFAAQGTTREEQIKLILRGQLHI